MSTAEQIQFISVDDYFRIEEHSATRNEYVNGWIRAMTGVTNRHNDIAVNILISLGKKLAGKVCKPCNSDTKLRIRRDSATWFYYPDVFVVCESNRPTESFQDRPVLIIEVLSPSTRAIDLDEKMMAYLTIDSLQRYVLLEQDKPHAIVFRRTEAGFLREVLEGLAASIHLPFLACELMFKEVYDGIEIPLPTVQEPAAEYQTRGDTSI